MLSKAAIDQGLASHPFPLGHDDPRMAQPEARGSGGSGEASAGFIWHTLLPGDPMPPAGVVRPSISADTCCAAIPDPSAAAVGSLTAWPGTERAKLAQALNDSREELRRLSSQLVSIQEEERRRIALDLHDGLGQSMSLIKLSVENAVRLLHNGATAEAGESLRELIPRIKDALCEVRRVSTELRPSILDDLGILPTLSWHFREFESVCSGLRLEKFFNVSEDQVPVVLHLTLYRILQEALHNVLKHSAASLVRVCIDRIDNTLRLQVDDNGRGFDPANITSHAGRPCGLGLSGMKERAAYSGGNLQLRSGPGAGTQIFVSWRCGVDQR